MDDRPNFHNMKFSYDTMLDAAPTLISKAFVAYYDEELGDALGHEFSESPCGFVPPQTIEFIEKDGFHEMYATIILFKSYCKNIYDLFVDKYEKGFAPKKDVSMEIRILKTEDDFSNGEIETSITKFSFKGITLLGSTRKPAVPLASAVLMEFEEKVKQVEEKFFSSTKEGNLESDSLEMEENNLTKEELDMQEEEKKKDEEVIMAKEEEKEILKKEEKMETPTEKKKREEEEIAAKKKEEEMSYEQKYFTLKIEFDNYKSEQDKVMKEYEALKQEKSTRDEADKNFQIEAVFATSAVSKLPKEKIEEFREEAKSVKFAEVNSFLNKVKAATVDLVFSVTDDVEINRMAILQEQKPENKQTYEWYNGGN